MTNKQVITTIATIEISISDVECVQTDEPRKALCFGSLCVGTLIKRAGNPATWWIRTSTGHFNTFEQDLGMAVQYCLEQARIRRRREGVHYHLEEVISI